MKTRHLERVEWRPYPDADLDAWPFTVPVVRQLIAEGGLEIPAGVTILLGENGSGKSTLIEAIAAVYPRAGFESRHARMSGPEVLVDEHRDEAPLRWHLRAHTHPLASPAGFFLRAELLTTTSTAWTVIPGSDVPGGPSRSWTAHMARRSSKSCASGSPSLASTSSTNPRRR